MVTIERKRYLDSLIKHRNNGQVKIITGIRRCGKSFLLKTIFREYLIKEGISQDHIIIVDLDDFQNAKYRNPIALGEYLRAKTADIDSQYYIFIDEIQRVESIANPYLPKDVEDRIGFVDVLNGLRDIPNVDIYATGSNSKMLSSDIATEFRGRGDVIPMFPLTYDEFFAAYKGDKSRAWSEFITYGGMPKVMSIDAYNEKAKYLSELFNLIYIRDVIDRNHLRVEASMLEELLNIISSAVGSLTNPTRIADTFKTVKKLKIKNDTISRYLDYFVDAFVIDKAFRYNIKRRSYIETPLKYYFCDIGLRNAKINFRQQEENHIMENVIYNELCARGFNVDVGVVEYNHMSSEDKYIRSYLEVDFVVNKIDKRYYIQSALTVADEEKRLQETNSLYRIDDYFKRIVVVKDNILPWYDERGVQYINIQDFLLNMINEL